LVSWAEEAGVLGGEEAAALLDEGADRPADAEGVVSGARELREALFDIFAAFAKDKTTPEDSLGTLNFALPDALSALRVAAVDGAFEWRWAREGSGLDRMLLPVIRDAAELLTSPELSRVRLCESETCDWLFFDQSRNRTRRWCDMSTCGNRAKARRHYERKKHG
jgi:predicted RNA-binding Zn ribbon-like protein